jgi:hypothetical protein
MDYRDCDRLALVPIEKPDADMIERVRASEVCPAMLLVGAEAYERWEVTSPEDLGELLSSVYAAMESQRRLIQKYIS